MSPLGSNLSFKILVVLSLCLFHAVPEAAAIGYPEVEICKRQECPSYKVIESNDFFEIRSYTSAKWITAGTVSSSSYRAGVQQGFISLFNYIRGGNAGKVTLSMTAPALTDILVPKSLFQVYLLVPNAFQDKPLPKQDRISSVVLPRKRFAAVKRFGGLIDDSKINLALTLLRGNISKSATWRVASTSTSYSVADYNPPFMVKGRVNELIVWFDKN